MEGFGRTTGGGRRVTCNVEATGADTTSGVVATGVDVDVAGMAIEETAGTGGRISVGAVMFKLDPSSTMDVKPLLVTVWPSVGMVTVVSTGLMLRTW